MGWSTYPNPFVPDRIHYHSTSRHVDQAGFDSDARDLWSKIMETTAFHFAGDPSQSPWIFYICTGKLSGGGDIVARLVANKFVRKEDNIFLDKTNVRIFSAYRTLSKAEFGNVRYLAAEKAEQQLQSIIKFAAEEPIAGQLRHIVRDHSCRVVVVNFLRPEKVWELNLQTYEISSCPEGISDMYDFFSPFSNRPDDDRAI